MSYQETLSQNARIATLRLLEDAPKYTSNISMISELLNAVGIAYTRDQVQTEVDWLKEQGLVTTADMSGFLVVTATQRGAEVAQGVITHHGVKRPRPGV